MCGELKEWAESIREDREPEPEQPPETTDKTDEDLAEQDQEEVCGDLETVFNIYPIRLIESIESGCYTYYYHNYYNCHAEKNFVSIKGSDKGSRSCYRHTPKTTSRDDGGYRPL